MSDIKLAAEPRSEFGKGAARRLRRDGKVPAVLYGHGTDPLHVALPGHDTFLALKHHNALFELTSEGETHLAVVKDVQRDPIRNVIEHVDFLLVKKGEKIQVEVDVVVVGESAPGTIHVVETQQLTVEAEATNLPTSIEVDITGLAAGQHVTAGDVKLPEGTTLAVDADHLIVAISEPRGEAADEAADAAVAAAASAASAAAADA